MPPLPSLIPDHLAAQMQAAAALATTPLWTSIALSSAAVLCLFLLYLRRRRRLPQPHSHRHEQVSEKRRDLIHPASPPPQLPDLNTPTHADFSSPSFSIFQSPPSSPAPPPFPVSSLYASAAPPLLPTIRSHSCDVTQQTLPPTITQYERIISADSTGPRRSIRGTIMRGGPLAPGVRRNQWTIKIR